MPAIPPLPNLPAYPPPLYPIATPDPNRLHGEVACKRAFNETRVALHSSNQVLAEIVNTTRFADNRWAERIRGRPAFLNKLQGAVVHFIKGSRGYHTGQQWGLWIPEQQELLIHLYRKGSEYIHALGIHEQAHCGCWLPGYAPVITHLRGISILPGSDPATSETAPPGVTPTEEAQAFGPPGTLSSTQSPAVVTERLPTAIGPAQTGESQDFQPTAYASYPTVQQ